MLETTLDVFKAALRSDPTVSPSERAHFLVLLRRPPKSAAPHFCGPRLLTRKATAEMLHRSLRFVDRLAEQGILRRVTLPGRHRSIGFAQADVERLILDAPIQKEAA